LPQVRQRSVKDPRKMPARGGKSRVWAAGRFRKVSVESRRRLSLAAI
jgi:hypothetical protein